MLKNHIYISFGSWCYWTFDCIMVPDVNGTKKCLGSDVMIL